MSKEHKEPKHHRPDGPRQPQRKDSLSSVLSWAGLQARGISPRTHSTLSTSSEPSTSPPSTAQSIAKSRRHSYGANEIKPKARKGPNTSRRISFSISSGPDEGTDTKTKLSKAPPASLHTKAQDNNDNKAKTGSTDKVNKSSQESVEITKKDSSKQPADVNTPAKPST